MGVKVTEKMLMRRKNKRAEDKMTTDITLKN